MLLWQRCCSIAVPLLTGDTEWYSSTVIVLLMGHSITGHNSCSTDIFIYSMLKNVYQHLSKCSHMFWEMYQMCASVQLRRAKLARCNKPFKEDRGSFTNFFKQWEFYEMLCVVTFITYYANKWNKRVRSWDPNIFYWAFSQYTKICGRHDHCFMCDIIKSKNTKKSVSPPHHLFRKPRIS